MSACIRKRLDGSVHPKSSRQDLRERELLEHHETELCSPSPRFGPTRRTMGSLMRLAGVCYAQEIALPAFIQNLNMIVRVRKL